MRYFLVLFAVFFSSPLCAQQTDDFEQHFESDTLSFQDSKLRLEKAIEIEPANARLWFRLGALYQSVSQYQKAEAPLEKAVGLEPENTRFLFVLGKNYYRLGKIKPAENTLLRLRQTDSTQVEGNLFLAKIYTKTDRYSDAYQVFASLVRNDSTSSFYFDQMAFCSYKTANYDRAIELYRQSLTLNPENVFTIKQLGSLYLGTKQYDSCIVLMTRAIEQTDSLFASFYSKRAMAHYRKSHYFRAEPNFEKAIALGDSSHENRKLFSFCLYETEKYKQAQEVLEKIVPKEIADYRPFLYLGVIYRKNGELSKSIEFLEKAHEMIVPGKYLLHTIYEQTAESYLQSKKYAKSIEYLQKDHELMNLPVTLYKIAAIYDAQMGSPNKALPYYERFLHDVEPYRARYAKEQREFSRKRVLKIKGEQHFEKAE